MKREYWRYFAVTFPYLARRKGQVAAMVALMLAGAVFALAEPWPLALLVDSVLGKTPPPSPIAALVGTSKTHLLVFAVLAGFIFILIVHVLAVMSEYVTTKLDQNVALEFRSDLYAHCQGLSQGFHDETTTGDSMYRINFEAKAVGQMAVALPPLAQSVLTRRSAVPAVLAVAAVGLVNQPFAILVAVVVALEAGRGWWRTGPGLRRGLRRAAP